MTCCTLLFSNKLSENDTYLYVRRYIKNRNVNPAKRMLCDSDVGRSYGEATDRQARKKLGNLITHKRNKELQTKWRRSSDALENMTSLLRFFNFFCANLAVLMDRLVRDITPFTIAIQNTFFLKCEILGLVFRAFKSR